MIEISKQIVNSFNSRDIRYMNYVAQGLTDRQISERELITPRTLQNHLDIIRRKIKKFIPEPDFYFSARLFTIFCYQFIEFLRKKKEETK